MRSSCHIGHASNLEIVVELRLLLGISYRGNPNREQPILAPKSQQVIFSKICFQNSNAVWSKVNKVRRLFLSSTRAEYDMKDTIVKNLN